MTDKEKIYRMYNKATACLFLNVQQLACMRDNWDLDDIQLELVECAIKNNRDTFNELKNLMGD